MRVVVTGAAGFIGSHTAEAALARGWDVIGIDSFTEYYSRQRKVMNLEAGRAAGLRQFVEADLLDADLDTLLSEVDAVIHLAAQPGVRDSWEHFETYERNNVLATQRLLAAAQRVNLGRFVYASSSSVYGDAVEYPVALNAPTIPVSPYGVTKLAAEHLCRSYATNFGVSTVSLRYFTVFGPRQRPDMATHRLISSAIHQTPFPMFGDGSQVRDFTYVADVVAANLAAAEADVEPGSVFNVAGGDSISLAGLIDLVGQAVGRAVQLDRRPPQPGDVRRTGGDITATTQHLGWRPTVTVAEGVRRHVSWLLSQT